MDDDSEWASSSSSGSLDIIPEVDEEDPLNEEIEDDSSGAQDQKRSCSILKVIASGLFRMTKHILMYCLDGQKIH